MAKKKKNRAVEEAKASMKRILHEQYVKDMQEGRVQRAHTFQDKKKVADKKACRKKNYDV